MTEQEFLEELKGISELAKEIRDYTEAWLKLAQRKRVFAVNHECIYVDQQENGHPIVSGWMWFLVDTSANEIFAGFSVKPFSDYVKCHTYGAKEYLRLVDSPSLRSLRASVALCHTLGYYHPHFTVEQMQQILCRMFQNDFAQGILCLKQGLVRLFAYIQEECANCAEEFVSHEEVYRWRKYDNSFVERMNNQYLMKQLVKTTRQLHDVSRKLYETSWYTDGAFWNSVPKPQILHQVENPLEAVLELAERVNQATKERKLFIGDY